LIKNLRKNQTQSLLSVNFIIQIHCFFIDPSYYIFINQQAAYGPVAS